MGSAAARSKIVGEPRAARSPERTPRVAIQPLGVVDPAVLRGVSSRIERTFAVEVTVLPVKPVPGSAFYRPRRRFRGDRVIEWLDAEKPAHAAAILGLMSRDLSATKGS